MLITAYVTRGSYKLVTVYRYCWCSDSKNRRPVSCRHADMDITQQLVSIETHNMEYTDTMHNLLTRRIDQLERLLPMIYRDFDGREFAEWWSRKLVALLAEDQAKGHLPPDTLARLTNFAHPASIANLMIRERPLALNAPVAGGTEQIPLTRSVRRADAFRHRSQSPVIRRISQEPRALEANELIGQSAEEPPRQASQAPILSTSQASEGTHQYGRPIRIRIANRKSSVAHRG